MQVSYRLLETNVNGEWLPIAVALPHDGDVGLHFLGGTLVRRIERADVHALNASHLWSSDLRWSDLAHCSPEAAVNVRHLLAEVGAHGIQALASDEDDLIRRRGSMEEIAKYREPVATTPAEAIRELKRGNSRFFSMRSTSQSLDPIERRSQAFAQTPFAVILGCSDSRVPVEFIFDQGPGNLFIIRVAGNVCGPNTIASVEYAVRHLKSHLVMVLGHESCGAVAAAMQPKEARDHETAMVRTLLDRIVPGLEGIGHIRDPKARMREAVTMNVREQVYMLNKNPVVTDYVTAGKIAVVGGYYSISSGAVDIFETDEELAVDPAWIAADTVKA